ncbi:hypothetical protein [Kineosporia sp. NBRC 101731]|uniref:hypothetical protein n=1 Tax=Kineosporia sp. NBRC 101731 TaxID=3032199 RepID=UPI0024A08FD6|nr:hypothetical protein [Kineosporia sp. NBRC 101731]GLY32995.1 hypothetical protein Kisp02_63600 [Kineosporia sp. NBRC 101731]
MPSNKCSADVYLWDLPYDLRSNGLAGKWQAEVWASSADGTALVDSGSAGSLTVVRETRMTAKATPAAVKKGKTTTITGSLTRADWSTWSFKPYASRTLTLQQVKGGQWTNVKKVKADAKGTVKTSVKVTAAASFRWSFAGDAASDRVTSPTARVKVK